jgi:bifunctional UDP-N-acetylglucosamine pyrophosphorylase/glucosamine-1-phosphate N-acetyltransferase
VKQYNNYNEYMELDSKVGAVVLAAGHGTRMKSDIPKMMHSLAGKPLVGHVVDAVVSSKCCAKPVVVVSADGLLVREYLGSKVDYVVQEQQLGTGHAVAQARTLLEHNAEHIVVLYGDMPFVQPQSIASLVERHEERGNSITLMTITVPHFNNEFSSFSSFSRIIRDEKTGHIVRDVQAKDCTREELEIHEVNPCYFCFNAQWLWNHIDKLDNNNAQEEYYLTDLLHMAIDSGEPISSISIEPQEARGVNTKEDLAIAVNTVA